MTGGSKQADGWQVAEQIRQGKGYKKNGQLGGDPLRDVVLAQAIQLKDERALAVFAREYQPFIVAQVRRFQPAGQDPTPCWNDLLIELGGYLLPEGTLVAVCYPALSVREDLFPNPKSFDPDHFYGKQIPAEMLRASTSTVEARVHASEICAWAMAGSAQAASIEVSTAAAARPSEGLTANRGVTLMSLGPFIAVSGTEAGESTGCLGSRTRRRW